MVIPRKASIELAPTSLYNFNVQNIVSFDSRGRVNDIERFKEKLLSSIKKPIGLEDIKKGLKQEIIKEIKVFVVFGEGRPLVIFFSRKSAEKGSLKTGSSKVLEYTIKAVDGKAKIVGQPELKEEAQESFFNQLAHQIAEASPFDRLGEVGNIACEILGKENPDWPLPRKKK